MKQSNDGLRCLYTLASKDECSMGELEEASQGANELHEGVEWQQAWNDVTGRELIPEIAQQARREDLDCFRTNKIYIRVPIEECKRATGNRQIGVRWVDLKKEDEINPLH